MGESTHEIRTIRTGRLRLKGTRRKSNVGETKVIVAVPFLIAYWLVKLYFVAWIRACGTGL